MPHSLFEIPRLSKLVLSDVGLGLMGPPPPLPLEGNVGLYDLSPKLAGLAGSLRDLELLQHTCRPEELEAIAQVGCLVQRLWWGFRGRLAAGGAAWVAAVTCHSATVAAGAAAADSTPPHCLLPLPAVGPDLSGAHLAPLPRDGDTGARVAQPADRTGAAQDLPWVDSSEGCCIACQGCRLARPCCLRFTCPAPCVADGGYLSRLALAVAAAPAVIASPTLPLPPTPLALLPIPAAAGASRHHRAHPADPA